MFLIAIALCIVITGCDNPAGNDKNMGFRLVLQTETRHTWELGPTSQVRWTYIYAANGWVIHHDNISAKLFFHRV